ncbi:hypothetical protein PENTCL1PPCAC_7753, partial [Pristionchus entomophagus]
FFLRFTMPSLEQDVYAKKNISNLPMELLRMIVEPLEIWDRLSVRLTCSAFEEAVATSTHSCRIMELQYDYEDSVFKVMIDAFELFGCTTRSVAHRTLHWRQRMFGQLRVQSLIVRTVRLIDIRVVNSFLDACIFDELTVHVSRHQGLSTRVYDLIAKAKVRVVLHIRYFVPTPKQFMTFSRPVEFHFFKKWKPIKDEDFLNVLRRGHSIKSTHGIKLRSEQTLAEAIKIVSYSVVAQALRIICIEPDFLHPLLQMTNAKKIAPLKHYHSHHTYNYLRAQIYSEFYPRFGQLFVSSCSYDEEEE